MSTEETNDTKAKHREPSSSWRTNSGMIYGVGLGIALGSALGLLFDDIALGTGIGLVLGPAIGMTLSRATKD